MNEQSKQQTTDYKHIRDLLKKIQPNGIFYKLTSDQVAIVKMVIKDNEMMDYELCNCGSCVRRLKPLEVKEVTTKKEETCITK